MRWYSDRTKQWMADVRYQHAFRFFPREMALKTLPHGLPPGSDHYYHYQKSFGVVWQWVGFWSKPTYASMFLFIPKKKKEPNFRHSCKRNRWQELSNENDSKLDTFIYYMHVNFLPACRGAVVAERNPLSEEFKANILKYVPLLRTREFPLHDAASYLESWIAGTWKLHPLLEIGALLFCNIQTLKMFSMVAKANPT